MKKESIIALLLTLLGIALITCLLVFDKIGQTTYAVLFPVIGILGLVLYGFRRLRELDLKNLRITLDKIEKTKQEIFAKEKDLRDIGLRLAKILAFNGAFQGRRGSEESNKIKKLWYRRKTEQLLDKLSIPDRDPSAVTAILAAFERFDALETPEEKSNQHQAIMELIRADLDDE